MKVKVIIKETYVYELEIDADSNKQAIIKAKELYKTIPDDYTFTADANSHVKTEFKIA